MFRLMRRIELITVQRRCPQPIYRRGVLRRRVHAHATGAFVRFQFFSQIQEGTAEVPYAAYKLHQRLTEKAWRAMRGLQ